MVSHLNVWCIWSGWTVSWMKRWRCASEALRWSYLFNCTLYRLRFSDSSSLCAVDRIPESISSCVRVRLPGSGHVGSTRGGRLPVAVDGLTNSQIWPVVAVHLTISNHGIQSVGTLRMVLAVVVTAEDILLLDMVWLILFAVWKQR